jgi:DnaJ-class molecular chaperone
MGEDIYLNIVVTLQESVAGVEKEVAFPRYEPCPDCSTRPFSACFSCGGKAEVYDRTRREKVRCEACSGRGFKNECAACLGASYVVREVR